jgi:methionyl-tRNA formyltransferase
MQPWPMASTHWTAAESHSKQPLRLIIHQTRVADGQGTAGTVLEAEDHRLIVAAGSGAVQMLVIQVPGKKPMSVADFLRGHRVRPGDRLHA